VWCQAAFSADWINDVVKSSQFMAVATFVLRQQDLLLLLLLLLCI